MSAVAPRVVLEGVSKRYTKYDDTPTLVSHALRWRTRTTRSPLWALRDVSLDVAPGECLGVIGQNGSGKSTLLRLLAGVTAPTSGRVQVSGRVAPLLSVGVGFHSELTGRENVYLNGIIIGLPREEVDRRFDEIVGFAQIEGFIDTPVKFYSSGMFMRLGFAVSVLADPDVLLIDEVLAVGDIAFQVKCFDRMQAMKEAGTTLLLVTHNLAAVRRLCDRAAVLHHGELLYLGDTVEAISRMHDAVSTERPSDHRLGRAASAAGTERTAEVTACRLVGADGESTAHVRSGEPIRLSMDVRFRSAADAVILGVMIIDESGVLAYWDTTPFDSTYAFSEGDAVHFEVAMDCWLAPGSYTADLGMVAPDETVLARPPRPLAFYVDGRHEVQGVANLDATFSADVVPAPTAQAAESVPSPVADTQASSPASTEARPG